MAARACNPTADATPTSNLETMGNAASRRRCYPPVPLAQWHGRVEHLAATTDCSLTAENCVLDACYLYYPRYLSNLRCLRSTHLLPTTGYYRTGHTWSTAA